MRNIRLTKNGIECTNSTSTVYLDPKKIQNEGVHFVSHAHIDHLPNGGDGTILSSTETNKIADLRGFTLKNSVSTLEHFTLVDSGHIFGSKGLLFDDIFYTGDISLRDRGFLKGAKIPKCKILITESTFGLTEFIFPKLEEIKKQVNELISELYGKGIPIILMGYQLGKAIIPLVPSAVIFDLNINDNPHVNKIGHRSPWRNLANQAYKSCSNNFLLHPLTILTHFHQH